MKLEIVNLLRVLLIDRHGQKNPWEGLAEVRINKEEDSCDVVNKPRVQQRTNELKDLLPPEQHVCGCPSGSG